MLQLRLPALSSIIIIKYNRYEVRSKVDLTEMGIDLKQIK